MKRKIYYLSIGIMVLAMAGCMKNDQPVLQDASVAKDATLSLKSASLTKKYIVVLNDDDAITYSDDEKDRKGKVKGKGHDLLTKYAAKDEMEEIYETALQGFSAKLTADQVKLMKADSEVKHIEENQIISLSKDEAKKGSPGGTPFKDMVPWGVARVGGGGKNYKGDNVAWIIDSGIDLTHPDLNVDVKKAISFVPGETPNDVRGHGTFIAGIIGAISGNGGILGVAPGVTVIPVKIFAADGTAYLDAVIAAINWVAKNAKSGDVVNLSFSLNTTSDALDEAILTASSSKKGKSIDFTIAAGNEGIDASLHSPARVKGPHIYTISAMAIGDLWASFSNWGKAVDYCAPGVNIFSTYPGGVYAYWSGTSFSSPHVAGLLLLGKIKSDGKVIGDPDKKDDPIAVHGK